MPVIIDGTNGISSVDGSASLPSIRGTTSNTAGVFFPAVNTVSISTSSSERINVSSSGSVGVGLAPAGTSFLEITPGTTTVAPLEFNAGNLTTTALVGAVEYDGISFYASPVANTRSVISTEQWVILSSNNNLANQTAAQAIFNRGGGPTNGAVALSNGTYEFECSFALANLTSSSANIGFALAGTATYTQGWTSLASKGTATSLATASATTSTFSTAANTGIVAAGTGNVATAFIKGILRVNIAGTIIPQVSIGVAAAGVVQANSFFKVKPVGNATVTTVGNWS